MKYVTVISLPVAPLREIRALLDKHQEGSEAIYVAEPSLDGLKITHIPADMKYLESFALPGMAGFAYLPRVVTRFNAFVGAFRDG